MKKILLFSIVLFLVTDLYSQVEVAQMFSHKGRSYGLGYGAFLKVAYPISEGDDVSLELGARAFSEKGTGWVDGVLACPLKLGYRYTLDRSGEGFYIEPQLGYNVYGVESYYDDTAYKTVNVKFHGIVAAAGVGYLFRPSRHQVDLGLHIETVFYKQQSVTCISLRLTENISFRKKEYY